MMVPDEPAPNPTSQSKQLGDLLRRARDTLGMPVAYLTRMDGTTQSLEQVDSSIPFLFQEGYSQPQDQTLCDAIGKGDLPAVMPDVTKHRRAMVLPATKFPRIRSFISVPITLSDGTLYGTFCAAGLTRNKELRARDAQLLEVLASAAAVIIEPQFRMDVLHRQSGAHYEGLMRAGGPDIVAQPIVDLESGERVGAEALSRFPTEWAKTPDVCFREAFALSLGEDLELLTLTKCGAIATRAIGYLSMNVSPSTMFDPRFPAVMRAMPLPDILLEISEGYPVHDYGQLERILRPLRDAGLRIAVDDVGAGFSSLKHIVSIDPDVIKLDRDVVTGVDTDSTLKALIFALVGFAETSGTKIVAEGVETAEEAAALRTAGVTMGQGWLFGRPGPVEALYAPVPAQRRSP
jgi:EAL domain-containing protein (putative c-di-GMP-specific phosphodiesterase class I)